MWECTECHHIILDEAAPLQCPVCNSLKVKFTPYKPPVGGVKTWQNLKSGFMAEAQAHQRNLAFARKANEEGLSQIAKLFRAVAAAEEIHAYNHFHLLGLVRDTDENLRTSFQRENLAETKMYPHFMEDAYQENAPDVGLSFSRARDVEEGHRKLYKKAMNHMIAETETVYYVCQVCGYTSDGFLPDECPVCGAPKTAFKNID
jgi:rubrerythrin